MEEKTQELLIILQQAEKTLTKIKISMEEKKIIEQKINSVNGILMELKKDINIMTKEYNKEEKQLIALIDLVRNIKINVTEHNIDSLTNLIMSNLPNGINKQLEQNNEVYKIVMSNDKQYIGTISLHMEEELIADISFDNIENCKKIIIKDIFKIYYVINYVNLVIGYGERK